jgi:hypothetical protein
MKWTKTKSSYKYNKWHKWFAWHPVTLENNQRVWLEIILRKQLYHTEWCWFDRMLCVPYYEYKECIFDLL